jgi:hypothetical protein
MGLQFIDESNVERTLTVEDMKTDLFRDSFSDLFKSLNGWRPRGEHYWTPEYMLSFFDTYDADMEKQVEQERQELEERRLYLEVKHGRSFASYTDADIFNVEAARQRYAREAEEEKKAQALKDKFNARMSPLPVIDAWEHGSLG